MEKTIRVEITENGKTTAFIMTAGESLKDGILRMADEAENDGSTKEHYSEPALRVSMPCGGQGICGKCKVRFAFGAPIPTPGEKNLLTPNEIDAGVRLLCRCRPEEDCAVEIGYGADETKMAAETLTGTSSTLHGSASNNISSPATALHYGIAIDLGTTTIAAALVETCGIRSRIVATASCVNSQRKYGADVISRIAAAAESEEAGNDLRNLVRNDIDDLMMKLGITGNTAPADSGIATCSPSDAKTDMDIESTAEISNIVIAGNTTMLHLLTGKDVSGLGVYPYTPVSLDREVFSWGKEPLSGAGEGSPQEKIGLQNAKVTLLPGISAFVGADIVSGLYYIEGKSSKTSLFIDLGTNGEMALIEDDKIKVTSTAAGPVFEAGGISCGVASVPGAIAHVELKEDAADPKEGFGVSQDENRSKLSKPGWQVKYETIDGAKPIGLCGTGVMELVSELARCGIIDETGLLAEEFFDNGFPVTEDGSIRLTQKDIRNVQMGKAAIASGIRALLSYAEKGPDRVYIAGGFGSHIDVEKIAHIKMLPPGFAGKIVAVGNASLKGAVRYLTKTLLEESGDIACCPNSEKTKETPDRELKRIINRAAVIELAATDSFDEDYIESMNF
ncbi:MAG: DUF4445 domain-containing protein [Butyrivibrio sp.]|nr:DUF4445 domain-containing protein [Butyrivibrio sp.]